MIANKLNSALFLNLARGSAICAVTIGTYSTAVMSIASACMLVFWGVSGQAFRLLKFVFIQPFTKALALFFVLLLIGVFFSSVSIDKGFDTLWSWRKLAFIVILAGLFNTVQWKQRFINYFIIGMSIALIGSYLAWFELIPSKGMSTGIIADNYSIQSISFVLASICCIFQFQQTPSKFKYLYAFLILLFAVNIFYVSESRTGYIGFATASVLSLTISLGRRKAPYTLLGLCIFILILVSGSTTLQNRINEGINELKTYQNSPGLTSIGARIVFTQNSLEFIRERPVFGYGTGSFGSIYTQHVANKYTDWRSLPTTDPHNQYLYIVAENGLLGLVSFLAFLFVSSRQGLNSDKFGIIATSVLCTWMICALFNNQFKTFIEGHLVALFVGSMLAPYFPDEKTNPINKNQPLS